MSELQFNYLFTLKNAHLSSNSNNFRMQPNIPMKFAGYVAWILLCKHCKFGEKIYYNSGDIEFFLQDYFFLERPVGFSDYFAAQPQFEVDNENLADKYKHSTPICAGPLTKRLRLSLSRIARVMLRNSLVTKWVILKIRSAISDLHKAGMYW